MTDVDRLPELNLAALGLHEPVGTVLADPPWRFLNRTGKVSPEHRRLSRYDTMEWKEIAALPVAELMAAQSHCYLWVPNALLAEGLKVMESWGFTYKANLVWAKRRKDGGPDGRGVGFYFRNTTELILFGARGRLRTLPPGRSQVNIIETRKREHSRKPDEQYPIVESCSPGPYLELFARYARPGWYLWGAEAAENVVPRGRQHPSESRPPLSSADGLASSAGPHPQPLERRPTTPLPATSAGVPDRLGDHDEGGQDCRRRAVPTRRPASRDET